MIKTFSEVSLGEKFRIVGQAVKEDLVFIRLKHPVMNELNSVCLKDGTLWRFHKDWKVEVTHEV